MIKYAIEKHTSAFPSKVLAREGGAHILNIELKEDTDNGWFVGKGAFVELDHYQEAAAGTATGKVVAQAANGNYYVEIATASNAFFVYQVPMIEEEYNNTFKKEENFFNWGGDAEKSIPGDVVRAYELKPYDVVEISEAGFAAKPSIGADVSLQAISGKTYAKRFGA